MSSMPPPADTPEFPAPQLLGIMLPSANTVVEPVTMEILRGLGVTPVFTRFAKRGWSALPRPVPRGRAGRAP